MPLQQLFLVLKARWRTAAMVGGAILFLALLLTVVLPKKFTAFSSVVVQVREDPVAAANYPVQVTASTMSTQVDILESTRVAQRVVKMMKFDQDSKLRSKWQERTQGRGDISAWLASALTEKLLVTPSRESNVVNIAMTWGDAKTAAALANAFAQAAIETNIELQVDPAKQYAGLFDDRSRELRADLELKQKRLSDFQKGHGIVVADERVDLEGARLNDLSTQLTLMQSQREDSQSRQRQVSGDNETLPEVLQSPLISSLKASLSQSEAKLQDIGSNLGKNHPDYKTAQAEIASLRRRLAMETANIVASLGNTTQVNLRREADLKAALEAQKVRVLSLRHEHDQAAILENDVLTSQRNLDAVTQRLAQSSLESQTQQTNVLLLSSATEPVEPSSPRILRNVAIGILLGCILGVGWVVLQEKMNPLVRVDSDVDDGTTSLLLGTIKSMGASSKARGFAPPTQAGPI